jgi:TRAP-type uncharacterized transport system fused permease subunit
MLTDLGIIPLAAHLFIFYFGMMSMVTPPVALAAYTAAAIAKSGIMVSGLAAFRFALVGFILPYAFVLKPALLLLAPDGSPAGWPSVLLVISTSLLGLLPLAAGVVGFLFSRLQLWHRALFILSSFVILLLPTDTNRLLLFSAFIVSGVVAYLNWKTRETLN